MMWKIATGVFAVIALGLGIWAFSLQSDIEDKDAQIAAQQKELDEQSDVAARVQDAAGGAAARRSRPWPISARSSSRSRARRRPPRRRYRRRSSVPSRPRPTRRRPGDAAEQAQARVAEATAKAEAAGACARGYLSALAGALEASSISEGVDQAKSDIEALGGSCSDTLDSN